MKLNHNIDDIEYKKIFFYKPVVNKIMHYSYFYKLIYDTNIFTLNTIIIQIDIDNYEIIEENNKFRVIIKINQSWYQLTKIIVRQEFNLLKKYFKFIFNK